mgnify:CR=1 FL=1
MYNLPIPTNGAPEVNAMRYPYTYPPMIYAPNAQSWGMHYPPQAGPEQGGALSPHHVGMAQMPPVQPGGVGSLHIDPAHVHANGHSHVMPHGVVPTAVADANGEQLAPGHHRVQPGGLAAPW